MNTKMKKFPFYLLSFTWGLPMTLLGSVVALILIVAGYKPKRWGYCYYFELGNDWGGLELGVFFLKGKNNSDYTKNHEHGHAIQNCYFGFFMPFIVSIPSAMRYWYREIRSKMGLENKTAYDDIWFEGHATKIGTEFIQWFNN